MYHILILISVYFFMFTKTLSYGYGIDDWDVAKRSVEVKKPKNFLKEVWQSFIGTCYKNPKLGHILTFLLHLTNTLLIYYAFGCNTISFFIALLFSIHPAATQGSVWLSGKGYSAATGLTLLMFSFKMFAPIFFVAALSLGCFAPIFSPLLFIGSKFWFWSLIIPIGLIIGFKFLINSFMFKWKCTPALQKQISFARLIVYFKSLGYYVAMAIFPKRLGVYHNMLYTYGLSKKENKKWYKIDIYTIFGVGIISALLYSLICFPVSSVTFGLLWFVILISQWCNFPITIQQAIAERYLYLPLIGMMYALVHLIFLIPDPVLKAVLLTVFIVAYLVRLYLHIPSYKNIHSQIEHNLVNSPECHALWTWKGQEEKHKGELFTALESWFQGWKLRKNDFRLNNNIALILTEVKQFDKALEFLKYAGENLPEGQEEAGKKYLAYTKDNILKLKNKSEKPKSNLILPGDSKYENLSHRDKGTIR